MLLEELVWYKPVSEQEQNAFTDLLKSIAFRETKGSQSPKASAFSMQQSAHRLADAQRRLLDILKFHVTPEEQPILLKRLQASQIKPTIQNMNRYLFKTLLLPTDEVPEPERTIIIRSGRKERFR